MFENRRITELSLSKLLTGYLSETGYPQVALAKDSGVSEGLISRLISGERTSISFTTAKKLSPVLGVTPDEIMKCARNCPNRKNLRANFNDSIRLNDETTIRMRFAHPFAIQTNFTGRQKERLELAKWIDENIYPVLVIDGHLGQGATSLAWVWVQQDFLHIPIPGTDDDLEHPYLVSARNYIEVVFWWSFKEPQANFSSFLSEAIKFISQQDIGQADTDDNRKVDILITLLQEHRTLLVLDSVERISYLYKRGNQASGMEDNNESNLYCIESVDAQEPTDRLLDKLTAIANSKALITTHVVPNRMRKLAGCKIKSLEPLSEKDSVRFLKRLGLTDSDSLLLECAHRCNGNPLALRLLAEKRIHSQSTNRVPRVITET